MASVPVHAAVQLDRTRVIVSQKDNKATINAHNRGKSPVLLQIWVEAGEAEKAQAQNSLDVTRKENSGLASVVASFIVDPPVVPLKPDETRALQVWFTQPPETMPQDRESQFWLNVLEVPAVQSTEAEQGSGGLAISLLSRIKVFYRPEIIADHAWPDKDELQFTLEKIDDNQHWLIVDNPAPIHRTISKIALHQQNDAESIELKRIPMIVPFGSAKIKIQDGFSQSRNLNLTVVVLDDRGEAVETGHVLLFPIEK